MSTEKTSPPIEGIGNDLAAMRYYLTAALTILFYDYALTISDEVNTLWKHQWSYAKLLWFFHRYYNLCLWVIQLWGVVYAGWTEQSCSAFKLFPFAATLPSQACVAIILMVRTYALYGRRRWILALLICTYTLTFFLDVWPLQFAVVVPFPPPFNGYCIVATTKDSGLSAIAIWIGIALFDIVVTGLTIYKTMSLYKAGIHIPLVDLLQRDGIFYFVVIVGLNMLTVLLFAFADGVVKVMNAPFTHIITVVVVSHLMLNLKVEGAKGAQIVTQGGRPTSITYNPASTVGEWALNRTVHSTKNPMTTFLQVYSQPEGDREEGPILDMRPMPSGSTYDQRTMSSFL